MGIVTVSKQVSYVENQDARPTRYEGNIEYEGKKYHFISGGMVGHSSAPWGTYGPFVLPPDGKMDGMGAVHIADEIYDPQRKVTTKGIGFGLGINYRMIYQRLTDGCILVDRQVFPELSQKLRAAIKEGKLLYAHITTDNNILINDSSVHDQVKAM